MLVFYIIKLANKRKKWKKLRFLNRSICITFYDISKSEIDETHILKINLLYHIKILIKLFNK